MPNNNAHPTMSSTSLGPRAVFLPQHQAYLLQNFDLQTLRLESQVLMDNPLGDPTTRFHSLLVPQTAGPWPVVVILAGFTGNGPYSVGARFNELSPPQVIDQAVTRGEAPEALYCFVDAMTSWGGSQFLNSSATGRYEDMIVQELMPALKAQFQLGPEADQTCLMGGSSGGYGALHLGSTYPELFGYVAAIAPDSFFEASLLPDLYTALPFWEGCKGQARLALEELRSGRLAKKKNWHQILNALGMAACYGSTGNSSEFEFPLDFKTGQKRKDVWRKYLEKDPLCFLPERQAQLRRLHGLRIDVGNKDNFHLQYGARQITATLQSINVPHDYQEFDGTHFDIGLRRIEIWKWLTTRWRK